MVPIVTFIGWHDSGKTTLAAQVVGHLKTLGYSVAVIKSTKDTGIVFDSPGTDTDTHRTAGADSVLLVAPDQMVMMTDNRDLALTDLALRYFPDVDIVIGEGFKDARRVAKIEVFRNSDKPLYKMVNGVIGVASDEQVSVDRLFRLNEAEEIASFIEKRFLKTGDEQSEHATLMVNGHRVMMKEFVQEALAGTVAGFIKSLKLTREDIVDIELRITPPQQK
ncbi:MAG: molybdopterin-guanine dinucleotide biosynthesis protein B [Thermodesulfobacteriota bacterium]